MSDQDDEMFHADDYPGHLDGCLCEEFDMDIFTGRCTCDRCGRAWTCTTDELNAEIDRQAACQAYYDEINRREYQFGWIDSLKSWFAAQWRRMRTAEPEDEIPF